MLLHRTLACSVALLLFTGCSAKSPISSKRDVLAPRLAALRDARQTAAAFKHETTKSADAAPVVSGMAPFDESNTLVIIDEEIDSFEREVDCTALARTGRGVNCNDGRFGAGNLCAMNVASVLKFDHFRHKDMPMARGAAQRCAEWLAEVKYVLVVHVAGESSRGLTAATYAKGSAVLVELASGKGLGKITFDGSSIEELGATGSTKSGRMFRYVTKAALSADTLVRNELAEKLAGAFPNAKIDRWVH